ncbi:MAG: DUF3421 domain-containing protein [Pyrinomonadaceae bacterium]
MKRNTLIIALISVFFTSFALSAYAQTGGWVRYRNNLPENAVEGGYEAGGSKTFICRVDENRSRIVGKLIGNRCYFNDGYRESYSSRFDVLVGEGYSWKRNGSEAKAVVAGGTETENLYVCRVSERGGVYPGYTLEGRCRFTRDRKDDSDSSYELLQTRFDGVRLLTAASRGNLRDLKDAIDEGQAINLRDSSGRTGLMLAAQSGHRDVVNELLYERADFEARDNNGNTALILAAGSGRSDVVELLIRAGADTRAANNSGETAFVASAAGGSSRMVELFLDDSRYGGTDENERVMAVGAAASAGRNEVISLLVSRGVDPDSASFDGKTPLMRAAENGRKDTVRMLLGYDVDLGARDLNGVSPFGYAVLSNSDDMLKIFIEEKELVGNKSPYATEGMRLAAARDKRDSLKYLFGVGVDVNDSDPNDGTTALMLAAGEGHGKAVEMILSAGANVNAQANDGRTALMLAAANSKSNTTKLLIKAKANLNLRDDQGLTALGWAIRNEHKDTRKDLEKAGASQ